MMTTQIYRVVFEDNQLLVIEKLRPFLSQRGEEGNQEALFEFIARTKKIAVFPVHRLDREVLGLMVERRGRSLCEGLRVLS
jgi:23S rRNA-/tRNA-specific pseudouridylate synthase